MNRLITIGPSHYCEKARWALTRLQIPFREEPHAPLFHAPFALRAGGRRTVPVLVTANETLSDSTAILEWADRQTTSRLYPEEPSLRREVSELETLFDEKLGPHTRRRAYFFVLDDPKSLARTGFLEKVPAFERVAFPFVAPLVTRVMKRSMKIDAPSADRSRTRIDSIFTQLGERLADGRSFLVGGRFTAADLTFAALAAPVVLPQGYGHALPPIESLPSPMRAEVEELRATSAGAFCLRLYRDERAAGG